MNASTLTALSSTLPSGSVPLRAEAVARLPTLSSQQLFRPGVREVQIEHHGMLYRLRVTAQGKLILTK